MNEELFLFLLIVGTFALSIWGIIRQQKQIQKARQQLYKLVQQAGGHNIVVWRETPWWRRGAIHFVLVYEDVNGIKHKHRVTRHPEFWGNLNDNFYWDRPLQLPISTAASTNSSAKEQIISEMDAEIKRLQKALRLARKED